MADAHAVVFETIDRLLNEREDNGEPRPAVALQSDLLEDLGLDSMEIAELSAILEDTFGSDPYTEGLMPVTVQELIAYFGNS